MNSDNFKTSCRNLCKKIVQLEETECTVCLEKINIGVLLLPCNHYQVCFKCFSDIEHCPLCRTKIKYIINYYSDNKYENNLVFLETILNQKK